MDETPDFLSGGGECGEFFFDTLGALRDSYRGLPRCR
jgi:hypothetical protein